MTDIALQALAGATYPLVHKDFTPDPLAAQLGDGVNAADPDAALLPAFPYLATPYSGFAIPIANQGSFPYIRCDSGKVTFDLKQ